MRNLVLNKASDEFRPSEADVRKFYGIKHGEGSGFVMKGKCADGHTVYIPYLLSNMTNGNSWYGTKIHLSDALADLDNRGFKVCEFDTFLEMAQWLSE